MANEWAFSGKERCRSARKNVSPSRGKTVENRRGLCRSANCHHARDARGAVIHHAIGLECAEGIIGCLLRELMRCASRCGAVHVAVHVDARGTV